MHTKTRIVTCITNYSANYYATFSQYLETLQEKSDSNFKCFIPLSLSQLSKLNHRMRLSSYHILALPSNDSISPVDRLDDYHRVLGAAKKEPKLLLSEDLRAILSKIRSLLPLVKSNKVYDSQEDETDTMLEGILSKAHISLESLHSYIEGGQSYTAPVGYTLNALMNNAVPNNWYYPHQNINKRRSLVEFIQFMRQLYYY